VVQVNQIHFKICNDPTMPSLDPIISTLLLGNHSSDLEALLGLGVYIISDGYATKHQFDIDCHKLCEQLMTISPFEALKHSSMLSVWQCFNPSVGGLQVGQSAYVPASASSEMGAYYRQEPNGARGELFFDYTKFKDICKRISVSSHEVNSSWPIVTTDPTTGLVHLLRPAVIIVLLPEVTQLVHPSLTNTDLGRVELQHDPVETEPLFFVATTANYKYERVLARAIGSVMGLADEYETEQGGPSVALGEWLDRYPNIAYLPDVSLRNDVAFKWRPFYGQTVAYTPKNSANALPDTASAPPFSSEFTMLYEGGGRFANHIFRSAPSCTMRNRIGVGNLNIKGELEGFCPVCRHFLTIAIQGHASAKQSSFPTLQKQVLEYDKIHWAVETTPPSHVVVDQHHPSYLIHSALNVSNRDPKLVEAKAFYGFKFDIDSTRGIEFSDIAVRHATYYDSLGTLRGSGDLDYNNVLKKICFSDILIKFASGASQEVFFSDEVFASNFSAKHSWGGEYAGDTLYQNGVKIVINKLLNTGDQVKIEISFVTRGACDDFDPGGAAVALKIYPQMAFTWIRMNHTSDAVVAINAKITLHSNVTHYMYGDATMCGPDGNRFMPVRHSSQPGHSHVMGSFNTMSFFTDSNTSELGGKMERLQATTFPGDYRAANWAHIFDYYLPDVAQSGDGSFTAVYGPIDGDNYIKARRATVTHAGEKLYIEKKPRQGAYDNVHVAGEMGYHGHRFNNPDVLFSGLNLLQQEKIVSAPFCGVACLHFHWRWADISHVTASLKDRLNYVLYYTPSSTPPLLIPPKIQKITSNSFLGWDNKKSHSTIGAPLLPPNQRLDVNYQSGPVVSPQIKILELSYTINFPEPRQRQVLLEQGIGWAMQYGLGAQIVARTTLRNLLSGSVLSSINVEVEFHKVYDMIRFQKTVIKDDTLYLPFQELHFSGQVQIPEGTKDSTSNWSALIGSECGFFAQDSDGVKVIRSENNLSEI
jgi:hypothetical protein